MNVGKLNSYFGEGTVLKGTLKFKGLLRFDGQFEGDVISDDTFIVGETGKVQATVRTGNLFNFGAIDGDVEAVQKVSLHASSRLVGNLRTPVLVTEENAFFEGACTMPPKPVNVPVSPIPPVKTAAPPPPQVGVEEATGAMPDVTVGAPANRMPMLIGAGVVVAALAVWAMVGGGTKEPAPEDAAAPASVSRDTAETAATAESADEAIARLSAAIEESVNDPAPRIELAQVYVKAGRSKEGVDLLASSVERLSRDVALRRLYAGTLYASGREKEAAIQFAAVARLDPDSAEALVHAGWERLDAAALDDAEARFKAGLDRNGDDLRGKLGMATLQTRRGEHAKAAATCKEILAARPGFAPALNRLAWVYAEQGNNLEEARSLSEKSLAVYDDIPEYIDTLSEVNFRLGNYDAPIELIRKAIQIDPGNSYYKRQQFKFERGKATAGR